ncbi:MAG TPA: hypothetical protein PLU05_00080 [Candidatus Cloacimonas acidaminovorans]|nr:hypothetical protein [Candidatus Cloacimonas acidaminovorans]HRS60638.1 hypothetical protein [Candidatus Cloacimonas sp.]HOM78693.1 hypothetical protein [Candidatus Cloacimonas acidaminovorans]HOS07081.1 hypothetical protein [Candidatus Cloacimonas acidaminovorans]HPC49974.1 hypothetical protein [Candidatus Cloacimonas acidaminovorans]
MINTNNTVGKNGMANSDLHKKLKISKGIFTTGLKPDVSICRSYGTHS